MSWGKEERGKLGSSKATEWNNNLMWRLFIEQEAKQMHVKPSETSKVSDYKDLPPHMRSVQKAILKSDVGKMKIEETRHTRAQASKELRESYKPDEIPKPVLGGARKLSHTFSVASSSTSRSSRPGTTASRGSYFEKPASVAGGDEPSAPASPVSRLSHSGSASVFGGSVIPEERLSILEQRMRELEERQRRDEELLRSRDRKLVAYQEALTHLVETVEKAKKKPSPEP